MYLAHHMKASLVLYITDMPTTAAWLDHVYGSYSGEGELFRDQEEAITERNSIEQYPSYEGSFGPQANCMLC